MQVGHIELLAGGVRQHLVMLLHDLVEALQGTAHQDWDSRSITK